MVELDHRDVSFATWQLPKVVVATHYKLSLEPDLDRMKFDGYIDIKLQVQESTNTITLHSDGLNIYNVSLTENVSSNPKYFHAVDVMYDVDKTTASFVFDNEISIGDDMMLSMNFTGSIDDKENLGLYRSSLEGDGDNPNQVLYSTQFGTHYARRVFPCWDEPSYKAAFDLTLTIPKDLMAISNNEVDGNEEIGDKVKYTFKITPRIATQSLAFAFGNLEYIESSTTGYHRETLITCRIYTLKGYSNLTRTSLDTMMKALNFFEEYLQIPYSMNKLDILAVPNHNNLITENWGLITILHSSLIIDNDVPESQVLLQVTGINIIHTVAQQWFGNLVTMKWWDDMDQ